MSYKEAGAYFVVLPRPGHPTYSVWVYSPSLEKSRLLFIHELSADINESLRMASTLFFFSRRCLLIVEYNEKRMQNNGDDIISFGRYHGHYLHEILKIDPAYLSWIAYKYTPRIPKQERFVAIAQVYHSVHLDIMQRKARQKRETSRFLGNEGEKLESLNLKVVKVRLEDDPYKTRVLGSVVQFFVRQIVTLTDPSGNLVIMKISSKTPSPVSCQLPAHRQAAGSPENLYHRSAAAGGDRLLSRVRVLVIDGQGGGLGRQLTAALAAGCPDIELTAVGTNSIAASAMLKAGAHRAATGENAVVVNCRRADIIVGPIGIVIADSLLGEITPAMAAAVCQSSAVRVLIPINHCDNIVVGVPDQPIGQLVAAAVEKVKELIR